MQSAYITEFWKKQLNDVGHHLAESIRSWGDHPSLQNLYLSECSLSEKASLKLVQSLSSCKNLTDLDLAGNNLREAGLHLAQSITFWGNDPPLQKLYLSGCCMNTAVSKELINSLSTCKHLITLDLGKNMLAEAGYHLAKTIRSWGNNPPLQKLLLYNCSLLLEASTEISKALLACKHLRQLNMGRNNLSDAGYHLVQSIKSWKNNEQLLELHLYGCSLPENVSKELLRLLSRFNYVTELDSGENTLGELGYDLAESIRSWGDDPPLKKLHLLDCSLTVTASLELVKSLSKCSHLTELNLRGNALDKAGNDLAASIRSWGEGSPLKKLSLHKCSLPVSASVKLLKSLASCGNLIELDIGKNYIGEAGNDFAQSIRSWKHGPQLQELMLRDCKMPTSVWSVLLQTLSLCKQLISTDVSDNTLGDAGKQLAQSIRSWGKNSVLERLNLSNCSMPKSVWDEIHQSLSQSKCITEIFPFKDSSHQVEPASKTILQQKPEAYCHSGL